MKLILLLIFISAAPVFCALAAGDSVKDAQLRGWSDQLATCHTINRGNKLTHLHHRLKRPQCLQLKFLIPI